MSIADAPRITIAPAGENAVGSGVAEDSSLVVEDRRIAERRDAWNAVVDQKLIEWGNNPDLLADEDTLPPTANVVAVASNVACIFRDAGYPPPQRVVPDGDGGITFERWSGDVYETLAVLNDESVWLSRFQGHRLQHRDRLAL